MDPMENEKTTENKNSNYFNLIYEKRNVIYKSTPTVNVNVIEH